MKFGFVAKHRRIWPAEWLCEALGVSRGGFYAWLTRPRSERSRTEEELGAKVRASDRTYGARRVWHDLLAEGVVEYFHGYPCKCTKIRGEPMCVCRMLEKAVRAKVVPPALFSGKIQRT